MKCLTLAMAVAMASQAQAQLYRESDGNVVMRGGDLTLRFYSRYGGAPLSWYKTGFPVLTNEFPGSGVSVAWRTQQDPTQASANGVLEHPIHILGDKATERFDYYTRETLLDAANGIYQVTGFAPDFWLSSEAMDDAIAPNSDGSDSGWRTPYAPGRFASILASPSRPVIFEGSPTNHSGLFFVGSENDEGSLWSNRLRRYEGGRVAAKVQISLAMAPQSAFAGIMFRKDVTGAVSKHDAYMRAGIHVDVNKYGGWAVTRINQSGGSTILLQGKLSAAQLARLNGPGVQIEVRTHNGRKGYAELLFDDTPAGTFVDMNNLSGANFGLFASSNGGYVVFGNRQVFDVGVEFQSTYSTWSNGVVSDLIVRSAPGVLSPHVFDRANMPGIFLNTTTFAPEDRRISLYNGPDYAPTDVTPTSYPVWGQYGFWAGNKAGTVGLLAIPEIITVDGQAATSAHCLLDTRTPGGEFVMMLNPLPADAFTEARELRFRARWQSHL